MKKIGIITTNRADYGIYRPLLNELSHNGNFKVTIFVTGSHLIEEFCKTAEEIEDDGFGDITEVFVDIKTDSPEAVAKAMGATTIAFSKVFAESNLLDLLFVLGDRSEMYAAATASVPFLIPLAHIHGGELTLGAIDDVFRHSLTKMSHLHFASAEEHAKRILQLGEEPWRVYNVGSLSLDNLQKMDLLDHQGLCESIKIPSGERPILVTLHPETFNYQDTENQVGQLIAALDEVSAPIILTGTNNDQGNDFIKDAFMGLSQTKKNVFFFQHLGTKLYFSLMAHSSIMVGNSSSGIIEAATFKLPVVNIGQRQQGRLRGGNVMDTKFDHMQIAEAICKACSQGFQCQMDGLVNPYWNGGAAVKVVEALAELPEREVLLKKQFNDI